MDENSHLPGWQVAPAGIILPAGEVHLWLVNLEQAQEQVEPLSQLLSADELERAGRFYFEDDRRHYVVGRATLRRLIGQYTGLEPGRITFGYGERGKPYLPQSELRFNLAHSHHLALLAFAWGRELGVDLEYMRSLPDANGIVTRFFSVNEVAAWRKLAPAGQHAAFFAIWTRKEAYIKAVGEGLHLALDSFDVPIEPSGPAGLLRVANKPEELSRWSLLTLTVPQEYAAALIVEQGYTYVRQWLYPSP